MSVRALFATIVEYTCGSTVMICRPSLEALEEEIEKHVGKACPLCQLEAGELSEEGFRMLTEAILEAEREHQNDVARSN